VPLLSLPRKFHITTSLFQRTFFSFKLAIGYKKQSCWSATNNYTQQQLHPTTTTPKNKLSDQRQPRGVSDQQLHLPTTTPKNKLSDQRQLGALPSGAL